MPSRRTRTTSIALAAGLSGAMVLSTLVGAGASSHREAPLITEDPVADSTDTYAFVAPDAPDHTVLIANWIPLEEPAGGPNFNAFGDDVLYTIDIDNDGDNVEDIVYEFRFRTVTRNGDTFLYNTNTIDSPDDPDWNRPQFYSVTRVQDGVRVELATDLTTPPVNIGPRSTPDYENNLGQAAVYNVTAPGVVGGPFTPLTTRVFAGQRDEVFNVDLGSVFDLLGLRPINEAHIAPLPNEEGIDATSGFNVHSIAIQVPTAQLLDAAANDPVIGVWSETYRRKTRVFLGGDGAELEHNGPWVQVARLGNPLVNEVVIPLKDKDNFNASSPADDAQFLDYVQNTTLDNTVAALYGDSGAFSCFPDVDAPRPDLVAIYLTGLDGVNQPASGTAASEMLRLNTSTPPTAYDQQNKGGVLAGDNAGFPNGRRPVDDVTDISLQAVAGAAGECQGESPNNALTDGAPQNDLGVSQVFPYQPAPHQGYDHAHDHTNN